MILSNPQAFFGLRANVTPTAPNVRNDNEVGVAAAGLALTGGNVAYSLRAKLAEGDVLDLDVLTGDASGSTISESAIMTLSGITNPAAANGVFLKNGQANSFPVFQKESNDFYFSRGDASAPVTWVLWFVVEGDQDIAVIETQDDVATPDLVTNWDLLAGVTATPSISASAFGEIIGGTGLDIYGETLPTIADVQGILIQCIAGAADIEVNGNELKQVTAGDTRCAFNVAGMPSYADTLEATATSPGTIIEITIIGKTA
jgi:hypothetical protein